MADKNWEREWSSLTVLETLQVGKQAGMQITKLCFLEFKHFDDFYLSSGRAV